MQPASETHSVRECTGTALPLQPCQSQCQSASEPESAQPEAPRLFIQPRKPGAGSFGLRLFQAVSGKD